MTKPVRPLLAALRRRLAQQRMAQSAPVADSSKKFTQKPSHKKEADASV